MYAQCRLGSVRFLCASNDIEKYWKIGEKSMPHGRPEKVKIKTHPPGKLLCWAADPSITVL